MKTSRVETSDVAALQTLTELVAIESVSADPHRFPEILKASAFIQKQLEACGCVITVLKDGDHPPLVIGTLIQNPKALTIGIYGHYDVQPEEPLDEWQSPPFTVTKKDGKLFARGIGDNKGHVIQSIFTVKRAIEKQTLKNNIVFVIEGEEEGGTNFDTYIKKASSLLKKVDLWFVCDVGMIGPKIPQICYGLRGIVYFEITVAIGTRDLHSGVYGNTVYNPIQVLSELFTSMKNRDGHVIVDHIMEKVRVVPEAEKNLLHKTEFSLNKPSSIAGIHPFRSLDATYPRLSSKIYPSMDVHGIISGYNGDGQKTIIPHTAKAKFSLRLVEHQNPDEIEKHIQNHVKKHIPDGVKYTLTTLSKSAPFYTAVDHPLTKHVAQVMKEICGNEVYFTRSGASIPAAEALQREFGKPVLPTGFLKDYNIHSPNEYIEEQMFYDGIELLEKIFVSL